MNPEHAKLRLAPCRKPLASIAPAGRSPSVAYSHLQRRKGVRAMDVRRRAVSRCETQLCVLWGGWGGGVVSHAEARRAQRTQRGGCGPARSPDPGSPTSLCLLAQDKKRCSVVSAAQAGLAIRASQAERTRVPSHAWAFVSGCVRRHSYGTELGTPSRAPGGALRRLVDVAAERL